MRPLGFLLLVTVACTQPTPKSDSDLPFCTRDSDCTLFRSACGKTVAFNVKFEAHVKSEFKKREEKLNCGQYPDSRRYGTRCEENVCVLLER